MNNNPLMQYARKPELTVKLACDNDWYPDGFIQYTLNDEVEVFPMLPKDELMLYNPDALLSGQATINLLKSCCPSILNVEKLFYPDANILLLAIKRATYGNEHKQSHMCPKCKEIVEKLSHGTEKDKKELDRLLKEHKITNHEEEFIFDIDNLLASATHLKSNYEVKIDNLLYNLKPHTIKIKEQYSILSLQRSKLLKMYKETLERQEELPDSEKNEMINTITDIQSKMIDANNEIFAESINFIKLPDDSIVTDKNMITEFIANSKTNVINKLSDEIYKINAVGLPTTIKVNCSFCNHEFEVPLIGYNQSDFFG